MTRVWIASVVCAASSGGFVATGIGLLLSAAVVSGVVVALLLPVSPTGIRTSEKR